MDSAKRPPISTLCSSCDGLFCGIRQEKAVGAACISPVPGNQTPRNLEQSANNGCHLCYIRWGQLTSEERKSLDDSSVIKYGFVNDTNGNEMNFRYVLREPILDRKKLYVNKTLLFLLEASASQFVLIVHDI